MSQALLFGIGCIVTVIVMTAVFILGFSQMERLEHDDDQLVAAADARAAANRTAA